MRSPVLALAAALVSSAALAQPAGQPIDAAALFHARCGMCHDQGGMGTGLLARRVQPAVLAQRANLNAQYLFQYARRGLGNMLPITPGEVSDPELKAIAAWLAAGPEGRK